MTTTALPSTVGTDETWLRLVRIGAAVATPGLVVLAATMMFWTTTSEGHFKYAADYWLTAPALPIGVGLVLHTVGVHRLQHGRDGRRGVVGVWLFSLCAAEIVAQCLVSLAVGAEVRWGAAYPLCALGSFIGLALSAVGSWRVGVMPRWMLGLWAPVVVFGSWAAHGPAPVVLAAFLIAVAVVVGRRVGAPAA